MDWDRGTYILDDDLDAIFAEIPPAFCWKRSSTAASGVPVRVSSRRHLDLKRYVRMCAISDRRWTSPFALKAS